MALENKPKWLEEDRFEGTTLDDRQERDQRKNMRRASKHPGGGGRQCKPASKGGV